MSHTVHAKVLRTHPDFSHRPGEIVEITPETFEKYEEKGGFFAKATPEEVKNAAHQNETATVPQADERAVVPAAIPKTAADAAKTLAKGAKAVTDAAKK